ncbi:MAG: cold shock domain-containing protein [Phascolarctobacterium sp.]|nr:cold shock domain-containing protein [Phascolarctobacterium sp.]
MTGIVEMFNDEKGYGFIRNYEDQVFFVHYSSIRTHNDFYRTLNVGDKVRFERKQGERGLYARNVRILN